MYAFSYSNSIKNKFGGDNFVTAQYKHFIYKINIEGDLVSSFACTRSATFLLKTAKSVSTSMHPEHPDSKDLIHFYQVEHPEKLIDGKKAKVWKFLTPEQYE